MKIALIQNASGPYVPLLEATIAHHRRYCERHGILYLPSFGRTCERHPNWDRWPLMLGGLTESNLHGVIWLDADTIIVGDEHLSRAIIGSINLCKHKISWKERGYHWNCGMMAISRSHLGVEFLRNVWLTGDVENPHQWKNQAALHTLLDEEPRWNNYVTEADPKWNSCPWENDCERPVVRAFHGKGVAALPLMQAELGKL